MNLLPSILYLTPHLYSLKMKLNDLCHDSSTIIQGNTTIVSDVIVPHHRGKLWDKLFDETSIGFVTLSQQAFEVKQLPGGINNYLVG